MGKGNTQLLNIQGNPVPTYFIDGYPSWNEIEEGLVEQKRESINDILKTKKSFCCKRTVVECLLPIRIEEKEIVSELQFHTDETTQTLENDLCEILNAEQIDESAEHLSSTRMNIASIICKNDLIMAVVDDNEQNMAVAFMPSKDTAGIENPQETVEYILAARTACNEAMAKLHSRWPTSTLFRTGPWTSSRLPEKPYEDISKYGY